MTNKKEEDDEGGKSGTSSGEIQFHYKDILSSGPRDDALPEGEIKRLLIVHQDLHAARVQKQKATRQEREALKQGRQTPLSSAYDERKRGRGFGGEASPYKKHPIADKFSDIVDPQVIGLPSENKAETNVEARDNLENQNRHTLRNAPKFNPKPRPY